MRSLPWMLAALLAACNSPEATRVRGGGPGGDIGNRGEPVQMHDGSRPYHHTERLVPGGMEALAPANQAREFGRR